VLLPLSLCFLLGTVALPLKAAEAKFPGLGDPGAPVALELQAAGTTNEDQGAPATMAGPDANLQLVATLRYDTGQLRDATHRVTYRTEPAGIVEVTHSGRVLPKADGEAKIFASGPANLSASVKLTVTHFANPPTINFPNQIVPIFTKLDCNGGGCHGKSGGQNGFALSLLGFDPLEDHSRLLQEARGRRVFPAAPDRSLLLQKAAGILPHGGGARMRIDSDDYRLLRRWIAQGMPYGSEEDPVLQGIEVFPRERMLTATGTQQLKVVATYSDGSTADVTSTAQYTANNNEMAAVDNNGNVELLDVPGVVAIMVRYQGQVAAFRATIPFGLPVASLPTERNFIDTLVFKNLKLLGLPPSPVCDDATFLRRVSIDIAGRLPTYEEALAFEADADPVKRDRLVSRLLDSEEYADFFALKWGAILRNKAERNVSRTGNFLFHAWIRDSLKKNVPYDSIVRQILTASGDVSQNPAVNWFQHVQLQDEQVQDAAQVFLGVRIQCAKCHHHPFEKWSQEDYWGLAAYFSTVRTKNGMNQGEKRIYSQRKRAVARHPITNEEILPAGLDAESVEIGIDQDPRLALADWVTSKDNRFFARALTNRYWKHFFGRGIVDPEDDMRATNPPSNPELLDALGRHFAEHNFDLKDLVRTICTSSTYQLSEIPNEYNAKDTQAFSRYYPRRLPAEVLLDSIDDLLGTQTGFNGLPVGTSAVEIPDHGGVDNFFLNAFGRPAGGSACECERGGEVSMAQSLHLLNSDDVYGKLESSRAKDLIQDKNRSNPDKITELYYRALARKPTAGELGVFLTHLEQAEPGQQNEAYKDILWALMNTKEFLFNH
jgi:hypothetical protein